jgi:hypothetical protein
LRFFFSDSGEGGNGLSRAAVVDIDGIDWNLFGDTDTELRTLRRPEVA